MSSYSRFFFRSNFLWNGVACDWFWVLLSHEVVETSKYWAVFLRLHRCCRWMLVTGYVGDGLCWWQFLDLSGQFHILMIDLLHWKSHQHHKTVVFKKSTTSRCSQNDCSRFRKDRQIRQQQRIMATNIAFTFGNITRIGSYAERRDIVPIMMRLIKMVLAVDLFPYNSATHFIENKIWHFETC